MIITVLFYIFVATAIIQIIYYLCFSFFALTKESSIEKEKKIPISVIICAKNESVNIQKFLPSIINQKYPNFEIVLINDASSDNTLEVMKNFQQQHKNIKIVNVKNIDPFLGNKKYALTLGIKASKNKHLLFTDADCKPASKHWIKEMSYCFSTEKKIVLGYGKYKLIKASFVNLLTRFETLLTAIQYFSYSKFKTPYMGVGRNLAYTKSLFYKIKGFNKHLKIKSGDDDLFIQQAANRENTIICTTANSFTISNAPKTFFEWFQQKRRHLSTASHYKIQHQLLLGLFFLSKILFLGLIFPIFFLYPINNTLPLLFFYYLIQFIVIGFSAKKLQEKGLLFFLPFLDFFLTLFQFSIFIANSVSKPVHWK